MWIYFLIILGLCNGAYSSLCRRKASEACLLGEEDFQVIPRNENELKDLCNFAKTTLQCAVDFVDKCGKRNFDLFHFNYAKVGKLMDATVDICLPTSELHSRVVQILSCAKGILQNDEELCQERSREAIISLEKVLGDNKAEKRRLHQQHDCLLPVLSANCFLVQITSKCGSEARDTAVDVMEKTGLLDSVCREHNREDALQLLEIVRFLTKEEIYVKQLL
ncbi:uncharacterized protein LOC129984066 [Argiope bruennichi]|uniref:uncharacterized protein LOC129984066 n=1 Tax=Argiope bruennichi TaxID=94029 RepID=UPI002495533B|nr:uncharacterized protein LOC129984066 [Argiope bruennichi]